MMLQGGNAVDAAIATAIALTVVEPTSNGIGSDAFAIVWDGSELHGLNASGRSPAGWTSDRFAGLEKMPQRGWDSVTVPGAVSAWVALSSRFGRLPFEKLFDLAIDYARNGYPVTPIIAKSWARGAEVLAGEPGFADVFAPAPEAGQIWRSAEMAATLERIALTGGEAFYRGDLAERMIAFSRECGGVMSMEDLESHQADWVGTISGSFHGHDIHEIPPNGQGISALMALGILEQWDRRIHSAEGQSPFRDLDPDGVESIHLQVEAMKLAFADLHHHIADPASMDVKSRDLLSPAYLRERASQIDASRAGSFSYGVPSPGGTVYLTAADEAGMMVSFIQSNYMGFGSGIVVPGTGISMQNRGCGFRSRPGHVNSVGPRKRPFHTIIPSFVMRDGRPEMSFGVMGGHMQPQGHLQMAIRVLMHGQSCQAASDAPRWQVTESGGLLVEGAMDASVIDGLRNLGHDVVVELGYANQAFGGAQLIRRRDGYYAAGSDHRKDGVAVGY
jgi:gamma-glutamyltranspeptidase/glutathione hydrolase